MCFCARRIFILYSSTLLLFSCSPLSRLFDSHLLLLQCVLESARVAFFAAHCALLHRYVKQIQQQQTWRIRVSSMRPQSRSKSLWAARPRARTCKVPMASIPCVSTPPTPSRPRGRSRSPAASREAPAADGGRRMRTGMPSLGSSRKVTSRRSRYGALPPTCACASSYAI